MPCTFSPLAENDLEDIADFIARDNPARAASFIDEIRKRCTNITLMPLAAPLHPELGKDIRMVVFDRYLIFYTVEANNVRIERILHGARNLPYLFDA
ncbi:MAG: type II toxin-antitoxin system RelE/ParE family toxin [Syntrophobacteraceae bacterium]